MSKSVTVIDYGMGNVLSVRRAFESIGANVVLTDDVDEIARSDYLVLPGVGAFGDCMRELEERNLIEALRTFIKSGNPMLGICVGMQVLMDESEEYGTHSGVGVISGRVEKISEFNVDGGKHNIPHIGWSEIYPHRSRKNTADSWKNSILKNTPYGSSFYFVHSFTAKPVENTNRLADCHYGGRLVSAAIVKDNVTGLQFHPEKSGQAGLNILSNYFECN